MAFFRKDDLDIDDKPEEEAWRTNDKPEEEAWRTNNAAVEPVNHKLHIWELEIDEEREIVFDNYKIGKNTFMLKRN